MRSIKSWFVVAITAALLTSFAAASSRKGSSDEEAIRKIDTEWSQAADAKDVDKFVSYYADDASMLPFNAPIATGKDQIRQTFSGLTQKPGFALTFAPTKIVVAKSGDMAYDLGTFSLKMNDAQGNPTTTPGKYVVVWQKRAGQWKAVVDCFNTDK